MKFNYGFEYSEKDYENLTKSTVSILGGLGSVLIKAIESASRIEEKRIDYKHEEKMKRMDHEILDKEDELDQMKEKLKSVEWTIKKMNFQKNKKVSLIDEDDNPESHD